MPWPFRKIRSLLATSLVLLLCSNVFGSSKNEPAGQNSVQDPANLKKSIYEKLLLKAKDFNGCFEEQISQDKSFPIKKVMALFSVAADGNVKASSIVSVRPVTTDFENCFDKIIKSVQFDRLESQDPVLIFYPVQYRVYYRKND